MELKEILQAEDKFKYQLLSRLQMDCNYYLGHGNRQKKSLWAGDEREQIETMKKIWESFSINEKPEWLTWEEILNYEINLNKGQ